MPAQNRFGGPNNRKKAYRVLTKLSLGCAAYSQEEELVYTHLGVDPGADAAGDERVFENFSCSGFGKSLTGLAKSSAGMALDEGRVFLWPVVVASLLPVGSTPLTTPLWAGVACCQSSCGPLRAAGRDLLMRRKKVWGSSRSCSAPPATPRTSTRCLFFFFWPSLGWRFVCPLVWCDFAGALRLMLGDGATRGGRTCQEKRLSSLFTSGTFKKTQGPSFTHSLFPY